MEEYAKNQRIPTFFQPVKELAANLYLLFCSPSFLSVLSNYSRKNTQVRWSIFTRSSARFFGTWTDQSGQLFFVFEKLQATLITRVKKQKKLSSLELYCLSKDLLQSIILFFQQMKFLCTIIFSNCGFNFLIF